MSAHRPVPRVCAARPGSPEPVWSMRSCQTFEKPSTTRPMPRVTMSGWTRKTPTLMPLTSPTSTAALSATATPSGQPPGWLMNVAVTKPAIEATKPTDRSMPPVSIVSVWQPARMASGTAARTITPTQPASRLEGLTGPHDENERRQQDAQRNRAAGRVAACATPTTAAFDRCCGGGHARRRRIWM